MARNPGGGSLTARAGFVNRGQARMHTAKSRPGTGEKHRARAAERRSEPEVPRNLVLPWAFSSRRVGEVARAGPYGGFLGQAWDPTIMDHSFQLDPDGLVKQNGCSVVCLAGMPPIC